MLNRTPEQLRRQQLHPEQLLSDAKACLTRAKQRVEALNDPEMQCEFHILSTRHKVLRKDVRAAHSDTHLVDRCLHAVVWLGIDINAFIDAVKCDCETPAADAWNRHKTFRALVKSTGVALDALRALDRNEPLRAYQLSPAAFADVNVEGSTFYYTLINELCKHFPNRVLKHAA